MSVAFDEARAAAARGEVPVGAAIVKDGRIVACRRQPPAGAARPLGPCGNARHPPGLRGARRRAPVRLRSLRDAGALHHVRGRDLLRPHPPGLLSRAYDPKGGAVDNGVRFFDQPTCHHAPEVYGGIRESEAAALAAGVLRGAAVGAPQTRQETPAAPRASRSGSPRPRNGRRSRRCRWPWARSSGARSRAAACGRRRGR